MAVPVKAELESDCLGKHLVKICVHRRKMTVDCLKFLILLKRLKLVGIFNQNIIEFCNKSLHRRDELDETFGNKDCSEIPTQFGTLCDDIANIAYDIVKSHALGENFLRDKTDVRLSLKSTFKSYVGSGTTHKLDEVVVFFSRVTVALDITDYLAVDLACCVKTERSLDPFVLEVTVNCLGNTYNLNIGSDILVIFGKNCGIGI